MRVARILGNTWAFRGYILASVRSELRARYSNSLLGVGWALVHPTALIALYTIVFSSAMRPGLAGHDAPFAYSVYLCAGILVWSLFSELIGRCVGVFTQNANLLKKVSFPKLSLPVVAVLGSLLNFSIILAVFQLFLMIAGYFPGLLLLAALPVIAILIIFTVGLGLLGGVINVFYRDVEQILAVVLQFWFWFTPIVYTPQILPPGVAEVLALNPIRPIVMAMQGIFLDGRVPDWSSLLYPAVLALGLLALSLLAYQRLGDEIVDEL